ncbi:MAG TPA: TetR/AcrR family transcriptional regulator [Candidatus Dormibacteraeota bacterium]|nr:TetR/AcrR family transcriptional regulator [Candidatus Dormibacteraeota bacterium]
MKNERQLAPWLVGSTFETVGRVAGRRNSRGRPKQHRLHRSERREQLLQACLVAFARDGLELTTMDSIAGAAGVSKPLVYRHFHNRRDALAAVVERESERLQDLLGIQDASGVPPTFEQLTTTFLRFAADSPASFRLLFHLVDAAAGSAKRCVDQLRDRVGRAMVASMLTEVHSSECLDQPPPNSDEAWLAGMISSIVEGVAGGLARGEDPALRAGALRQLLRPEGLMAALIQFRNPPAVVGLLDQEPS